MLTHPGPEDRISTDAKRLPATVIAGLSLMAGAFGLDLAAHAASLDAVEPVAHLAGMAGMAMTWLAVVVDGARHRAQS